MKIIVLALALLSFCGTAYAEWGRDAWGHRTKVKNYWQDRDGDGVPNYYDKRDDKKNVYY